MIKTAVISTRSAIIRSGPSLNYQIIANAKKGETVEIISQTNSWFLIKYKGKKGYIFKGLIKIENK